MAFGQGMPEPSDKRQRTKWFGEANRHETPDTLSFFGKPAQYCVGSLIKKLKDAQSKELQRKN
jgi:hypothetical protein